MAGFKTHLTVSTIAGVSYGTTACLGYGVPLSASLLAGGLCSVSGMLPDVDSDSGRPLRESLAFGAAVVPMMLVERFRQLGLSPEMMVIWGAAVYLFIRFVFGEWLRRYTVHRGMFHSIPAAIIFGELAFLLASGDVNLRIFKAGGVVLGYLSHLTLDELYSIQWHRGRIRFKQSFGTALKLFGHKWWSNGSAYLKLALLTFVVLHEPGWMEQFYQTNLQQPVEQAAVQVHDRLVR
jgi:hypothetical protein